MNSKVNWSSRKPKHILVAIALSIAALSSGVQSANAANCDTLVKGCQVKCNTALKVCSYFRPKQVVVGWWNSNRMPYYGYHYSAKFNTCHPFSNIPQ